MGAFGEMLIQYWGGDINVYRGNKPMSNPEYKKEEKKKESDEDRALREYNEKYNQNKGYKANELRFATEHLNRLTNGIMYRPKTIDDITEESFKDGFVNKLKFSSEVADIMWNKYCEFVKTYVKK